MFDRLNTFYFWIKLILGDGKEETEKEMLTWEILLIIMASILFCVYLILLTFLGKEYIKDRCVEDV